MAHTDLPLDFGGFVLADMQLALPMDAVREVIPAQRWLPLPCAHPAVVGGVDLRGVAVPVLDLRTLLSRPAADTPSPCVLIVVLQGRLLGLLADQVTGIFRADDKGQHALHEHGDVAGAAGGVMTGTVRRADTGALVSVLSAEALMQLRGVPMVDDPEPGRQRVTEAQDEEDVVQDQAQTVVLLRCGQVPFAINALAVHATLPDPRIQASPLARGHCRGVVDHGGMLVPAVDLQSLCGLGAMPAGPCQAFMVAWPEGMVAFLVTAVLDVVLVPHDAGLPVPPFALPRADLMHLALSLDELAPARMADLGLQGAQFLLLDTDALMRCEEVCNLAQANARQSGVSGDARSFVKGVVRTDGLQRAMLTYSLNHETATPLEQVQEILPYSSSVSIFRSNGPLLGFTMHRGQSIPVLCLSRLSGGTSPTEVTPAASILIVKSDDELVGFAVPHLKSIEAANWEPEVPRMGQAAEGAAQARKLARVGTGAEERMLPVIDLAQMAQLVRNREIGVMAA